MSTATLEPADVPAEEAPPEWLIGLMTDRLRRRRFALLPVLGPGAPATEVQGRTPGEATAPEELSDLISSIEAIGVLQPVLAEEEPAADDAGTARIVVTVGERRLRAVRWGAVHRPDNPHFQALPAVVCPGPLSEEERRIWQLVENLAREPLRPADLAQALLLHRCALLIGKLLRAGHPVPVEVSNLEDPVARWHALEKIRGTDQRCAAPWAEVLTRLGLQLTPRKAREIVRAFAGMPRELAEEMDAAKISVHTRIRFIELRRGRQAAAEEIWAAVKTRGNAGLLPAAVGAALDGAPDADAAVDAAEDLREAANVARAHTLSGASAAASTGALRPGHVPTQRAAGGTPAGDDAAGSASADPDSGLPLVEDDVVAAALGSLRTLAAALRRGRLDRHDAASLRLITEQVLIHLPAAPPPAPAVVA